MQQVAQVATHATITVASARTIKNKQYKRISPGCSAINLATILKASDGRHRCRYMIGTMKFAINDHAKTRRSITNTHVAITHIKYTLCVRRNAVSLMTGTTRGSESSAAKIKNARPTSSEKRK